MSGAAIVLFNLGGPDSLEAVRPFLRNLFDDPAIVSAPRPVRWLLARGIAARRATVARAIYRRIGGASPIRPLTAAQAASLECALADVGEARAFVAMRYWRPMIAEAARAVAAMRPDRIVLLPLYPQFSTATAGSSFAEWRRAAAAEGLRAPTASVCCYPDDPGYIAAQAALIRAARAALPPGARWRLLFSAHGLPKRIVARGDPYRWQIERSAAAIAAALPWPALDWRVCYQSRVGPLEWIGPSIDEELNRAGAEGRAVLVAPISFVSEHSETLVELDIDYRAHAARCGVPHYARVPAAGTNRAFIAALAERARAALRAPAGAIACGGRRACPARFGACARRAAAAGPAQ